MKIPTFVALLTAVIASAAMGSDWPQLQNGPARLGYTPERIGPVLKNRWAVGFAPERLFPGTQPIVADGKVFIGTAMGTFHALNAESGKSAWKFKANGPILHTAGVADGKVFFGCMDGRVYALNVSDGTEVWTFDSKRRTGFSTAVLLADSRVHIANRDGTVYALAQADGRVVWQHKLEAPVLMSSALSDGKLYVPAMDMRVYALDAATGKRLWVSKTLTGAALKDYWPVAYKGFVIIRTQRKYGKGAPNFAIKWQTGMLPKEELDRQLRLIEIYRKGNPSYQDMFVLDAATGEEAFLPPHFAVNAMNGAVPPPCVDGDGLLIVPATIHSWYAGWGRLDLEAQRIVEVMTHKEPNRNGRPVGTGNTDETLNVSAAGRVVLAFHTEECNAHFTGIWDLDKHRWTNVRPYHADNLYTQNTQGGGGSPPVIANGMVLHTSWNTLNARVQEDEK